MNEAAKPSQIDRLLYARIDAITRQDQFRRDVLFPWGWFGRGYFVDRDTAFEELKPYFRCQLAFSLGLIAIVASLVVANGLPVNLTNGILLASLFLLMTVVDAAMAQSVAVKLRLVPSPMRVRFVGILGRSHDIMPTGMLCILLPVYALIAIACVAALYLGGFDWQFTFVCAFMTVLAAAIGRTLYSRGKDL